MVFAAAREWRCRGPLHRRSPRRRLAWRDGDRPGPTDGLTRHPVEVVLAGGVFRGDRRRVLRPPRGRCSGGAARGPLRSAGRAARHRRGAPLAWRSSVRTSRARPDPGPRGAVGRWRPQWPGWSPCRFPGRSDLVQTLDIVLGTSASCALSIPLAKSSVERARDDERMRLPAKATHAQTRQHNHRLVLRTLYDLGPISRAEVARSTGLTRTTVSDVVGDLLDEGMVEESVAARPPAARARSSSASSGTPGWSSASTSARAPSPARSSTSAARSAASSSCPSTAATATPRSTGLPPRRRAARGKHHDAPRHRRRDAGPRRHADRHDPMGGQPRLAGPAARRPPPRSGTACRPTSPTTARRRRWPSTRSGDGRRRPNLVAIKVGRGSAPASSSTARCSRATASGPARSATWRSSTTAPRAAAAVRLPRDGRRAAGRSPPVPPSWPGGRRSRRRPRTATRHRRLVRPARRR